MNVQNIRTIAQAVTTNTYTFNIFKRPAEIKFLHIVYTSSATVGNRQILMALNDASDNLVVDVHAGTTQAASLARHYSFSQGIYRETAFVNNSLQIPWPTGLIVPVGYKIKVYDSTNVSATDTMAIDLQFVYLEG